jgi:predicted amidohydrolase
MLRIGYYQFRPTFGAVKKNLGKVTAALASISADIIVLPELAFTGYYFKDRHELLGLAEDPVDSPTVVALAALCRQQDFFLVTGFAERCGDKLFNSALLIGPDGLVATYRKLHLFNEEKNNFDPGDLPLAVQTVRGAKLGMMVCFDWAFPEVARSLTLLGAQVLCHPSNLVLTFCQDAMRTRCIENRVFAITTNRYGADIRPQGTLKFTGQSQLVAPGGKLISKAPAQRSALEIVEIDPDLADNKKITALNDVVADRRPKFYVR